MPCLPSLGSKAPDFKANTTFGPIQLSDYTGKWVVLFSHPGDFTPVCTTEFLCFAKYYPEFQKRNTDLIGLSIDSNSSHLAWVYNIFTLTGVEIPFPIIEDRDMKISNLYGMISEPMSNTSTIRSVFIIDDKQILRAILYYPLTTGRNIPEILRIIEALQTTDKDNVVTPANWFPGMPVILPYPTTYKELKKRIKSCDKNCTCMDWYLCFVPDKNVELSDNNFANYIPCVPKKTKTTKKSSRPQITDLKNQPIDVTYCPDVTPIVMEYVLGNPKNVDANLLDAVIYAFVEIKPDGTLLVPTPKYLNQLVNLRKENPDLQVIAAIGGWGADGFSDAALTPASRYNFARQVNSLINQYKLDGVDIDWEYPGSKAAGIKARPEDKENFTLLLTAIRDVIGDNKWLSVASVGDNAILNRGIEVDKIAPLINYFNLMSYDFTAGETGEMGQRHQSNLYESSLSLPGYSVDKWIKNLENAGMPKSKILLGLPFYGRLGAKITRSFDDLRENYINKNGYIYNFDNQAQVPYLTKDGLFAMAYDNELSIYLKGQYVLKNCLGGLFAWTSTYDQANILARAMYNSINNPVLFKEELEKMFGPF
ncbi:peroxiredoxin [Romboutsia lituseburensis]|uniref:Peroxiredoxin n=1 Tax=Romboutsia lituseburensis DSM 797 TaxID=1121325 RepID=A0A1G9L5E5_9FIRM|nr:peroxiredoxin [Romboutsia lituseburensis]CEH35170.1 Mitochondrial peroxiredoxin PRX1 [Romboutsia lituseburensis]SDL57114.1 Alkyl hydroperoxide reductase subunit AhpC (peroxiredoxin) [Romboutsia lituseburensis DSM 797]